MWYFIPDYINWLLGYKNPNETTVETKEQVQQKNVETQTEPEKPPEQNDKIENLNATELLSMYIREKRKSHRK